MPFLRSTTMGLKEVTHPLKSPSREDEGRAPWLCEGLSLDPNSPFLDIRSSHDFVEKERSAGSVGSLCGVHSVCLFLSLPLSSPQPSPTPSHRPDISTLIKLSAPPSFPNHFSIQHLQFIQTTLMLSEKSRLALVALQKYEPHQDTYQTEKRSAVLVALIENPEGELEVLLTVRSSALRTHAGDVAFPGGN